jgi:hypothetical protein
MKMRKLILCLFISLLFLALVACEEASTFQTTQTTQTTTFFDDLTIDCIIGYIWDGEQCVVNPDTIVVDSELYWIFYEGADYNVFKKIHLSEIGTDDEILLGDYNGRTYYFSSGTHYLYYLVVRDDETVLLNVALEADWFTLEELVNQFEIEELYSYPIEE